RSADEAQAMYGAILDARQQKARAAAVEVRVREPGVNFNGYAGSWNAGSQGGHGGLGGMGGGTLGSKPTYGMAPGQMTQGKGPYGGGMHVGATGELQFRSPREINGPIWMAYRSPEGQLTPLALTTRGEARRLMAGLEEVKAA